MDKVCFKCGELKALTEFYLHRMMKDGHLNKCKVCTRKDTAARTARRDPAQVREEKRLWAASANGLARQRRYLAANRETVRERQRQWSLSASGLAAQERRKLRPTYAQTRRKANFNWNHRNRDKRRAHLAVESAIERGLLVRLPCEVCSNPKSEAHHDDYSKPLDVRWLCRKHHAEHHRLKNRGSKAA